MKVQFLPIVSLLLTVSLTSCWQKETEQPVATSFAATDNVVYLHKVITKSEDASSTFDRYIKSGNVLVDFYAEWCGPCKMMSNVIGTIANKFPQVTFLKVDTDQFPSLSSSIKSIPTIVFYKNGVQVTRFSGARDKNDLTALLNKYFVMPS